MYNLIQQKINVQIFILKTLIDIFNIRENMTLLGGDKRINIISQNFFINKNNKTK